MTTTTASSLLKKRTELIHIAEYHNSSGLQLYEKGSVTEANIAFVQVLQRLRALSNINTNHIDDRNDNEKADESTTTLPSLQMMSFSDYNNKKNNKNKETSTTLQENKDTLFVRCNLEKLRNKHLRAEDDVVLSYVFTSAMKITNDIDIDIESFSAIVLYNIAVAKHVEAITSNTIYNDKKMNMILKLYDLAINVVQEISENNSNNSNSKSSIGIELLMAALCNNMASIYSTCFIKTEISYELMEDLSDHLNRIENQYDPFNNGTTNNSDDNNITFPTDEFLFFVANVNISLNQSLTTAPAA